MKSDILSDFAQAFATNLDPSKVADVEIVKIILKNIPQSPSNKKTCRTLPFNILEEAEKMVQDLVSSGVIRECTKPTQFVQQVISSENLPGEG